MNRKKFTRYLGFAFIFVGVLFLSSCNRRGYGCPGEMNLFEFLTNLF